MARLPGGSLQAPFVCPEVQEAKITETKINEARENYRPAAERASLLYFILNDLNKINPIYQFSLKVSHPRARGQGTKSTGHPKVREHTRWQEPESGAVGVGLSALPFPHGAPVRISQKLPGTAAAAAESPSSPWPAVLQAFNVVFEKAIQKTPPAEEVRQRVINLTDEITYSVYMYTARGLFERDKLIFLAQVTFQVTHDTFCPQTAARAPALAAPRLVSGAQTPQYTP